MRPVCITTSCQNEQKWGFPGVVNNRGTAAGSFALPNPDHPQSKKWPLLVQGCVWEKGVCRTFESEENYDWARFDDINDSGIIAGFLTDRSTRKMLRAYWVNGAATRLKLPEGYSAGSASAISNSDKVAGRAGGDWLRETDPLRPDVRIQFRSCLWLDGEVIDLTDLRLFDSNNVDMSKDNRALAIYDAGTIVGRGYSNDGQKVGSLFDGATTTDLNLLIPANKQWHVEDAIGINNVGQIACNALHDGKYLAVLLTPE